MSTELQVIDPNKQIGSLEDARKFFDRLDKQISKVVQNLPPAILLSAAMNSVRKNPKLLLCTQLSMASALMVCAETGLIPDSPAQECHLVPLKNNDKGIMEVNWRGGYRGLIKLARMSDLVEAVEAEAVYEKDFFKRGLGTDRYIKHEPAEEDRGKIKGFYSVCIYKSGYQQFEYMTLKEVEAIRDGSVLSKGIPWTKYFSEMGRKTAIRRLAKRMPLSPVAAKAIEMDAKLDMGEEIPSGATVTSTESLGSVLQQQVDNKTAKELLALIEEKSGLLEAQTVSLYNEEYVTGLSQEDLNQAYGLIEKMANEEEADREKTFQDEADKQK